MRYLRASKSVKLAMLALQGGSGNGRRYVVVRSTA